METTSAFLRGIYSFTGAGLGVPAPLDGSLVYTVPSDKRSQMIYFRGGNSADGLVAVTLTKDGKPFRTFPIGAKGAVHVSLAVVEDLLPESTLTVLASAPSGVSGDIVLEIGFIEI